MQDSVFLDNRTFQRVWQRVAGSMDAPVTTPPEADTLTDLLAECIRAKAAGAAFYTALSQRIRTGRRSCSASRRRSGHIRRSCRWSIFCARASAASRPPPARVWARPRRICAASIRRSLSWRSGSTRRRTPRRPRCTKRWPPWRSRTAATPKPCETCSPVCWAETNTRKKCVSFKMVLDFMTNLDYNVQADNLKCKQPEQNVEKSRSLVERARLEIVYTPQGYRGFESLLLRHKR